MDREGVFELIYAMASSCPANSWDIKKLCRENMEYREWLSWQDGWDCFQFRDCPVSRFSPDCGAWLRSLLEELGKRGFFYQKTVEEWVSLNGGKKRTSSC
jgi:hypothetical protein